MVQMTERSAKWMATVKANFAKATGKPVDAWVALARKHGFDRDAAATRAWLKKEHGLTMVQANCVLITLFPREENEDELLDAQYSGAKAGLRPVYDKLAKAARALGRDVMVAPRKSQVTFARKVTFAVVRVGAKDRVDLLLRLSGQKPTKRLVANAKATGSDPTHVVALRAAADVDRDVTKWLALAYDKAAR
jgi:Domain of unknown function (DUF5655)/Domain of unknown function (DUF4287)